MELKDTHDIPVAIETVWAALNDTDILAATIPGCQELIRDSDTELSAKVKLKIGPVSATFSGNVILSDLNPPHAYRISGKGSGGVAGGATGSAMVTLSPIDEGTGTRLSYDVTAAVTGKIAQLGSRLIESTSKKLAGQFFAAFAKQFEAESQDETSIT
ncbi:MAG: carbon monoxide dehydrogenase subunit G [Candidatus Puniceispirillum sp.]|nr:carbon monoxide dehydrogenase subunit G [Candidatus Puniceispirillum sp.]